MASTNPEGYFSFHASPGTYTTRASMPGYPSAEKTLKVAGGMITLPQITLLGGDASHDDVISKAGLVMIGKVLNTVDGKADINGNGFTDIYDLVLAGKNFDKGGPLPWKG